MDYAIFNVFGYKTNKLLSYITIGVLFSSVAFADRDSSTYSQGDPSSQEVDSVGIK